MTVVDPGVPTSPDVLHALAILRDVVALERGRDIQPSVPMRKMSADLRRTLERHALVPAVTPWAARLGFSEADATWLKGSAKATVAPLLRNAGSVSHVHEAFQAAGVQALNLKGVTLSLRTTGRLDGRISTDLDVLVAPESVAAAELALQGLGYTPCGARSHPFGGPHPRWAARTGHHVAYTHPSYTTVELHWEISQPGLLPWRFDHLWRRRQLIDIGAVPVPALGDVDELVYCGVHGSVHRYVRLAWLLDFVRLLRRFGHPGLDGAIATASSVGVLRSLAMSATMAAAIDSALPAVPLSSREGRIVKRLVDDAWGAAGVATSRPTRLMRVRDLGSQMRLRRGMRFKAVAAAATALPIDQLESSRFPGSLPFVTVPLRPLVPRRFRSRPLPPWSA